MKITIEIVGCIVRVEVDDQEIATAAHGEAAAPSDDRVNPRRTGGGFANAGGNDVTSSVLRAPVEAQDTILAGGVGAGIDDSKIDRTASGPDVKRALFPMPLASAARSALFLRPNCQRPGREDCAGQGRVHCHSCNLTAAAMEIS